MSSAVIIPRKALVEFGVELLISAGVAEDESEIVVGSLVEADLRGHPSHGVVRIPDYVKQLEQGHLVAGVELEITCETASIVTADARFGFGQVQMVRLIDQMRVKVQDTGIACGTLLNCGHIGRLSEWVERAASAGWAALLAVNDNGVLQCVAPPGGQSARISTNPIAIGVPTSGEPLVLDISTSAVANGKIKVAHLAGEPCPPGWLQDADGNPTTDPAVRFTDPRGTILPLGGEQGYKGFGLGLLFDILVGGLSGGFCPPAPADAPGTNNVLLVLWDAGRFAGTAHFLAEADKLIDYVRNTPRKPGTDSIRLPGDRSIAMRDDFTATGIPLQIGTWQLLQRLADELTVTAPQVDSTD